jgi:hypothetical protein
MRNSVREEKWKKMSRRRKGKNNREEKGPIT